jgi:hypothetical protein
MLVNQHPLAVYSIRVDMYTHSLHKLNRHMCTDAHSKMTETKPQQELHSSLLTNPN